MASEKPEVVNFKFAVESKTAIAEATRFQKELTKRLKLVEKTEKDLNNGLTKYLYKMGRAKQVVGPTLQKELKSRKAIRDTIKNTASSLTQVTAVATKTSAVVEELKSRQLNAEKELAALQKEADAASRQLVEDKRKGLAVDAAAVDAAKSKVAAAKEGLADIKAVVKEQEAALKGAQDIVGVKKEELAALKEQQKASRASGMKESAGARADSSLEGIVKNLSTAVRESGEDLVKPFEAFARKDLAGVMEEGGTLAGKAFRKTLVMAQMGKAMKKDPSKAEGMGTVLKGVATMAGKMAPVLDILGKMAPAISLMGTAMMSLVKMFIDAEASATEFNKEILASSSSSGFMIDNMHDVGAAAADASKFLRASMPDIEDWRNVQRGVTKDMVASTTAALGAEGVSVTMLRKQLDGLASSTVDGAKDMQNLNDVTWMSTAFSRQFGVSLSEVTQLQGEMMTEMGANLTSVETQFQNMDRSAEQAGVASNKFFGIIRSFSSDMSLFTLRMEDLTKVMMVLGKTMSPRNAQKFLQTVTQQFKGASLMDRTRSVLLGGKEEMKGIAQEGAKGRTAALGVDLSRTVGRDISEEIKTLVAGGSSESNTREITAFLAQFGDKLTGAQREAVLDAARMQGKLNSDDTVDIASAIKDASPIDAIKMLQQISERRFGKPLEELTGIQRLAIEQMANINDEQIDQMYKMKAGLMQTQEDLIAKIGKYQAAIAGGATPADAKKAAGFTDAELTSLTNLGTSIDDQGAAATVRAKSAEDIWNSMDATQQELLKGVDETKAFQTQMGSLQTSIADKMAIVVDLLTTSIYKALMAMYDALIGLWDGFMGLWGDLGSGKIGAMLGLSGPGEKEKQRKANRFGADIDPAAEAARVAAKGQQTSAAESTALMSVDPGDASSQPIVEQQSATTESVDTVNKTLKRGIVQGRPTQAYNAATEDATLKAIRQGLFEYYLYSQLNPADVMSAMGQGMDPMSMVSGMSAGVSQTGSTDAAFQLLRPHATGGVVTGMSGNMAKVNSFPPAPPGEGWTSVGRGETITPAGGRGGGGGGGVKVELELKGDLRRFIDARVVDGAAQFERNKRLR